MTKLKASWHVVDKGVNGRPYLWANREGGKFVMIDIFNVRPDRCYAVLTLNGHPASATNVERKVIGVGCSDRAPDWARAYESAKRIAVRYMNENSD